MMLISAAVGLQHQCMMTGVAYSLRKTALLFERCNGVSCVANHDQPALRRFRDADDILHDVVEFCSGVHLEHFGALQSLSSLPLYASHVLIDGIIAT